MSDCIFCKVIKGELPSTKIYEDKEILAFKDIHPVAPVHILVVPKKHFRSLIEVKDRDKKLLGKLLLTARNMGEKLGISKGGYKIIINNGEESGQLVFHLHIHLIGGWETKAKGFII